MGLQGVICLRVVKNYLNKGNATLDNDSVFTTVGFRLTLKYNSVLYTYDVGVDNILSADVSKILKIVDGYTELLSADGYFKTAEEIASGVDVKEFEDIKLLYKLLMCVARLKDAECRDTCSISGIFALKNKVTECANKIKMVIDRSNYHIYVTAFKNKEKEKYVKSFKSEYLNKDIAYLEGRLDVLKKEIDSLYIYDTSRVVLQTEIRVVRGRIRSYKNNLKKKKHQNTIVEIQDDSLGSDVVGITIDTSVVFNVALTNFIAYSTDVMADVGMLGVYLKTNKVFNTAIIESTVSKIREELLNVPKDFNYFTYNADKCKIDKSRKYVSDLYVDCLKEVDSLIVTKKRKEVRDREIRIAKVDAMLNKVSLVSKLRSSSLHSNEIAEGVKVYKLGVRKSFLRLYKTVLDTDGTDCVVKLYADYCKMIVNTLMLCGFEPVYNRGVVIDVIKNVEDLYKDVDMVFIERRVNKVYMSRLLSAIKDLNTVVL